MVRALIYEAVNVSDKIQPSVLLRPFSAILENVDFSRRNISPRYSYLPSHYVFPFLGAVISIGSQGAPHNLSIYISRFFFFHRLF
ncbi:hypothetical protein DBV15_07112 [Temnothorax longispinosus]|uniref:Uncharacterized protein n=1 Tax=Temnothorax longispinosus TaxID=300112 RepID=A0A4S2KWX0_9HYME|nr:hypothetical protein DBV15_07112 [Temnothorax longispinosus]